MANPFDLSEISFENKDFWCFFYSVAFHDAYTEDDVPMSELIENEYTFSDVWVKQFVQYSKEAIEHHDGLLEKPTLRMLRLGNRGRGGLIIVQFHPGDILYYSNGNKMASLGPHFYTHYLTLDELLEIAQNSKYGDVLFMLLLPIASVCQGEETLAKTEILERVRQIPVFVPIARQLTECVIKSNFDNYGFETDAEIGIVSKHPYSLRNPDNKDISAGALAVLNKGLQKIALEQPDEKVAALYKKIDAGILTATEDNQEILFVGLKSLLRQLKEDGENRDTAYEHFLDLHNQLLKTNFPAAELAGWLMKEVSKAW